LAYQLGYKNVFFLRVVFKKNGGTSKISQTLVKMLNEVALEMVVGFLMLNDLLNLIKINRSWSTFLGYPETWWRIRCKMLSSQHKLFIPTVPQDSWERMFELLGSMKDCWNGDYSKTKVSKTKVSIEVIARFKPKWLNSRTDAANMTVIKIPLHQRVALLKVACNEAKLTSKQALQMMKNEGEFFQKEGNESSKMICDFKFGVHTLNDQTGQVLMTVPSVGLRSFKFNGLLNEHVTQLEVRRRIADPLVFECINGRNCTVIAYGQTGSGKTHTMMGSMHYDNPFIKASDSMGLIPSICESIFTQVKNRPNIASELFLSYVEIHGDHVHDLLNDSNRISKATAVRYVLSGGARHKVRTLSDIETIPGQGELCKTRAATEMNERSTRAHSVLIMDLVQSQGAKSIRSSVYLADLGGSEQMKKSKVEGQ